MSLSFETFCDHAAQWSTGASCEQMLESGVLPVQRKCTPSPLCSAAENGHVDVCRLFASTDADDVRSVSRRQPCHSAGCVSAATSRSLNDCCEDERVDPSADDNSAIATGLLCKGHLADRRTTASRRARRPVGRRQLRRPMGCFQRPPRGRRTTAARQARRSVGPMTTSPCAWAAT